MSELKYLYNKLKDKELCSIINSVESSPIPAIKSPIPSIEVQKHHEMSPKSPHSLLNRNLGKKVDEFPLLRVKLDTNAKITKYFPYIDLVNHS